MSKVQAIIPSAKKHPEEALNLPQIFQQRAQLYKDRTGLLYSDGTQFCSVTWSAWSDAVRNTAMGLCALGVRKGGRVAIISENRPEWTYADLGILSLGAINVPIYPTSSCEDVAYILKDAGAQILFVSSVEHEARLRGLIKEVSSLKHLIRFDPGPAGSEGALIFSEVLSRGRDHLLNNPEFYETLCRQVAPADVATIIYTSGTTGPPKGVMLTHHNFIANIYQRGK